MVGSTNVRFLSHSKTNSREQRKKETKMGTPSPSAEYPGSQIRVWVDGSSRNLKAVRHLLPCPLPSRTSGDTARLPPPKPAPSRVQLLLVFSIAPGGVVVGVAKDRRIVSVDKEKSPARKKQTLLPLKESCNGSSSSFAPGALVQQQLPAFRSVSAPRHGTRKDIPHQTHP